MSDQPLVSVVVPFFDSAATLEACIEALRSQDSPSGDYEIILVDNGSADSSPAIAARRKDVTLLTEKTPGAYAARNAGIRRARAPIIAFTDADCVVEPHWLRAIVDEMASSRTAVVIGQCHYPDTASLTLRLLGAWENAKADYVIRHCPLANRFAYCNNMAVRASVFTEIGLFKEWKRAADSELVHRLATERPDLDVTFAPAMRITHLEFVRGRARAERLRLYTRTNAKIPTFQELNARQKAVVLLRMVLGLPKS
jgi:glycosyltransferase involved in cell wall biosynthesis